MTKETQAATGIPSADLPPHIPVCRSESEIPLPSFGALRQHCYYLYGGGSTNIAWSPPTDLPLYRTRWAPLGKSYPPADKRYMVRLCDADGGNRSGPIVIDPQAPRRKSQLVIVSWADYRKADNLYRSKLRNKELTKKRHAELAQHQGSPTAKMIVEMGMGEHRAAMLIAENGEKALQLLANLQAGNQLDPISGEKLKEHVTLMTEVAKYLGIRTRR